MGEFELYDIRWWSDRGLTTIPSSDRKSVRPRMSHRSVKKFILGVATAAFMNNASLPVLAAEPGQSAMMWHELLPTDQIDGMGDTDAVPSGYWPQLVSAVKRAKHLPVDDYSFDPDPLV